MGYYILGTLIILIFAVFYALKFNSYIETTLALSAFSIIFIMYLAGLCGNLFIGYCFIIGLTLLVLIDLTRRFLKDRSAFINLFHTPVVFFILLFILLNIVVCNSRLLSSWDEFSHWGRVVKNMYLFDRLGNIPESTVHFRGYPPAAALFQYFFVRPGQTFHEPLLYAATNLFLFTMIAPAFKFFHNHSWKNIILPFIILMSIPLIFFDSFWSSIYVDGILAFTMAYILIIQVSEKECVFKWVCISMGLMTLLLLKASGTGLAAFALLFVVLSLFLFKNNEAIPIKRKVCIIILYLLVIIVAKKSWDIYLSITQTSVAWDISELTVRQFLQLLVGKGKNYQYQTIKNFILKFVAPNERSDITFPMFDWFLIILALGIFICYKKKFTRKESIVFNLYLMGTMGIYALSLLILYCFTYSEYEALNLASIYRYMGTIYLAMIIFCLYIVFTIDLKSIYLYMMLILTVSATPKNRYFTYTLGLNTNIQKTHSIRAEYKTSELLYKYIPLDSKVYFISQNDQGFDKQVSCYNATPIKFGDGPFSLGLPYYEGDIWTKNMTLMEWEDLLLQSDCSYLYLYKVDDSFKKLYGSLFASLSEVKDNTLFSIKRNGENIILEHVNFQ